MFKHFPTHFKTAKTILEIPNVPNQSQIAQHNQGPDAQDPDARARFQAINCRAFQSFPNVIAWNTRPEFESLKRFKRFIETFECSNVSNHESRDHPIFSNRNSGPAFPSYHTSIACRAWLSWSQIEFEHHVVHTAAKYSKPDRTQPTTIFRGSWVIRFQNFIIGPLSDGHCPSAFVSLVISNWPT